MASEASMEAVRGRFTGRRTSPIALAAHNGQSRAVCHITGEGCEPRGPFPGPLLPSPRCVEGVISPGVIERSRSPRGPQKSPASFRSAAVLRLRRWGKRGGWVAGWRGRRCLAFQAAKYVPLCSGLVDGSCGSLTTARQTKPATLEGQTEERNMKSLSRLCHLATRSSRQS